MKSLMVHFLNVSRFTFSSLVGSDGLNRSNIANYNQPIGIIMLHN